MQNTRMCDGEYNKTIKTDKNLDIKNCPSKECLIGKLVLEYEDQILKITEILIA